MELEKYLTKEMTDWIEQAKGGVTDITLTAGRNMFAIINGQNRESSIFVSKNALAIVVEKMCRGSLYANQGTLKEGYITLDNGLRVGAVGSTVSDDNGKITHLRDITSINIRIAREIKGAADRIMPYIMANGRVYNTLIISPPSRGKTTILRDAARQCGNVLRCGIVDERSEIAGVSSGKISNDIGKYSFVIDACPKPEGISMMLRSMAPEVIFTDEIGGTGDEEAIGKMMNAGVKIVCTAHGYDEKDVMRRRAIKALFFKNVFERVIVLSSSGTVGSIAKVIKV